MPLAVSDPMKFPNLRHRRTDRSFANRRRRSSLAIERLECRNMLATVISPTDVNLLLERAAAASSVNNAIIAVVDRDGDILGVKVESGVSVSLEGQPNTPSNELAALVFAIDGAVAEARSAAFFSSDQGPLTSRTVGFVSQSTITQREVQSDPDLGNSASIYQGPGTVARIGVGGNFPPNALNTPSADLFGIEFTNRDDNLAFNVPTADLTSADINSDQIVNTESFGVTSGLLPGAQGRGIGTLPGGIPLYKDGVLVGGIGVFFPGPYGYADYEQGFTPLPANASPSAEQNAEIARMETPLEETAEWMAFAATNGSTGDNYVVGTLHSTNGATLPMVPGYNFPGGPATEIDMAGIILDEVGPNGPYLGLRAIRQIQASTGTGNSASSLSVGGFNPGNPAAVDSAANYLTGQDLGSGWLVTPHGTAAQIAEENQIVDAGIAQADQTRSAIRQLGSSADMVFAVTDTSGNVLALYRMANENGVPDSPIFSIDVAVAKARNDVYYDSSELQPEDEVYGSTSPSGPTEPLVDIAFTSRTFRYLAQPFYPEGIDGAPPGPFSALNDPGINPRTGEDVGPPRSASVYSSTTTSVMGYTAFNANANFRDPFNKANQNGVVYFPGSMPLYVGGVLSLGLGVSGDGVAQDDVVTAAAGAKFAPPASLDADNFFVRGVRLPYMNYDRNPDGGA